MNERLEEGFRSLGAVHDVDDGRHEVVVEFPHDVLDSYNTSWRAGCFTDSLRESLPPLVWNHDLSDLIGRAYKYEADGQRTRLFTKFSDFDAVPRARQVFAQIRDGDVPGFSFHFRSGQTRPHPTQRNAREFIKARMIEHSAVTAPSIPGAVAVGIRSQEAPALEIPTIEEIIRLRDLHVIDEEGVRALIEEHHPHLRDHLRVVTRPAEPTPVEKAAQLLAESGLRDMVIRIASDGTVSTDDPEGSETGSGDDDDPATLASAVDAALDEACNLFGSVDITGLPDEVQQGIALAQAAGVAVDELLDVMGVADPDDGSADGDRAAMSAADEKKLSDDDFAYIDSKGGRHLPIQDPPHVRSALARFDQTQFESDDAKAKAKAKIEAAAKRFGIDTAGAGKRSGGDDAVADVDLDRVLEKLARR